MLSFWRMLAVSTVLLLFNLHQVIPLESSSYLPIVIVSEYKKQYELVINNTMEYVFLYPVNNVSTDTIVEINALFYYIFYGLYRVFCTLVGTKTVPRNRLLGQHSVGIYDT